MPGSFVLLFQLVVCYHLKWCYRLVSIVVGVVLLNGDVGCRLLLAAAGVTSFRCFNEKMAWKNYQGTLLKFEDSI